MGARGSFPGLARIGLRFDGDRSLLVAARRRARALTSAGVSDGESDRAAVVSFTADALGQLALTSGSSRAGRSLVRDAAETAGLPPAVFAAALAPVALRDPARIALPPREAIGAQLRLLLSLPPLEAVSLWTRSATGGLRCRSHQGGRPSRGVRNLVREVLSTGGPVPVDGRRTLGAVPVGPPGSPRAALAARFPRGSGPQARDVLEEAAPLLAFVLERETLLDAAEGASTQATRSSERRLARFGLDLHDGPAQTLAALLADVHLFRGQLEAALGEDSRTEILRGRVEDLEARALRLNAEIRELARMAQAPLSLRESVSEVIQGEAKAFAQGTGIEPRLRLEGELEATTPSQRIALLRGIQEALVNAREHGRPGKVSIRVAALSDRLEADVRDDGRGFDVGRALSRARRDGRMGLLGIAERAMLLGGWSEVKSKPGGPTSVRIVLPRWEPNGDRPGEDGNR